MLPPIRLRAASPIPDSRLRERILWVNSPPWILIASETGGRAFYNANALGDSIQRAVDDLRVTYVLGFYPEEAWWDGKYHRLARSSTSNRLAKDVGIS